MKTISQKTIIKIWLLSFFLSGVSFSVTRASQQNQNPRVDCHLFNNIENGNYQSILQKVENNAIVKSAFWLDNLKIALANLHAHCCASQSIDQKKETCLSTVNNRKNRNNFPESTSLLDHLVDVQIRSWKSDSTYKGLTLDPKFKKRREELKEKFLDTKGKLPSSFTQNYRENRDFNAEHLLPKYGWETSTEFIKSINGTGAINAINSINDRNLRTKYLNTCPIAIYLYFLLTNSDTTLATLSNNQCILLTNNLIADDISFLNNAIIYKSNTYTTDTIQEYGINYFWEHIAQLFTDLNKANSQLLSTTRQINKLVPICN